MSNASSNDRIEPLSVEEPATWAHDELRLQRELLQFLRVTAVNQLAGLDPVDLRTPPLPSLPSPLGVIKRLTALERWWISIVTGGSDLPLLSQDADTDPDVQLTDTDTPHSVVEDYRAEWSRSDQTLSGLRADSTTPNLVGGKRRTVRWIYAHVIQETARAVGQLDVLRALATARAAQEGRTSTEASEDVR
ncbi:DUF664 domain-containing protein [Thermasporomyces composti]|uniref:Uncharacterized protein DUF664 n=1 Tax=Thermasporomyces composti TaxID=696763 RepID=A0A3D9VBX2_THECX|nr:DUF664 domain-containing protein [Thermasporomyces composti]REF37680.1 uncharacterized protein DUF664 [Thermasporomyces composti]